MQKDHKPNFFIEWKQVEQGPSRGNQDGHEQLVFFDLELRDGEEMRTIYFQCPLRYKWFDVYADGKKLCHTDYWVANVWAELCTKPHQQRAYRKLVGDYRVEEGHEDNMPGKSIIRMMPLVIVHDYPFEHPIQNNSEPTTALLREWSKLYNVFTFKFALENEGNMPCIERERVEACTLNIQITSCG